MKRILVLLCLLLLGCQHESTYGKQELIQTDSQVTRITYPITPYDALNEWVVGSVERCRLSFHKDSQERQFSFSQYEEPPFLSFLFSCYEYTNQEINTYEAITYNTQKQEFATPTQLPELIENESNEQFFLNEHTIFIPQKHELIQIPRTTSSLTLATSSSPIVHQEVDQDKPMVALTFDDGPNNRYTPQILKILRKYNAYATFFVIGKQIASREKVIETILNDGHQIGIHTFTHRNLTKLKDATIQEEINLSKEALAPFSYQPTIVRPPYGAYNDHLIELIEEPLVLWTLDTRDWESLNTTKIVKMVKNKVKNGDIILFHDMYDTTVEAIDILVPFLIKEGYQLVRVDDLVRNCTPKCVK